MTFFRKTFRQLPPRPTHLIVLAAIVFLFGSSGCVQRRMTIRSNPPGARVYVDDYEIGDTPVSASFTYYGTRKIRLVKDGYETLTVMQKFPTPWYEIVPLDFISENFVLGKITNRLVLDYQLQPKMEARIDQLQARAEDLRRSTHGSAAVPLAPPAGALPQPQQSIPQGNFPPTALPPSSPPPGTPEMSPVPSGIGGQPVHSLQP